jgi:uncharacterized Fe-S radical SAM superfamily protein PflX
MTLSELITRYDNEHNSEKQEEIKEDIRVLVQNIDNLLLIYLTDFCFFNKQLENKVSKLNRLFCTDDYEIQIYKIVSNADREVEELVLSCEC